MAGYAIGSAVLVVIAIQPLCNAIRDLLDLALPQSSKLYFQNQVRQFCERVAKMTDHDDLIEFLTDQVSQLFGAHLVAFYVRDEKGTYTDMCAPPLGAAYSKTESDPLIQAAMATTGATITVTDGQAILRVPLFKNNVLEGLFVLENPQNGLPYDPSQLAVADSLAYQVGNALTGAKYGRFLGRNLSHLSSLTVFSKMVRHSLDVGQLVKIVGQFLNSHVGISSQLFFVKSKTGLTLVDPNSEFAHIRGVEFQLSAHELDPLTAEIPYVTAFNFIIRPEVTAPLQPLFRAKFGHFESRELKLIPLIYQQELIGGIWFCVRDTVGLNRSLLYAIVPEISATLRNIQMYRGVLDQQYLAKQTIDSIQDGVVIVDDRNEVVQFNRAADVMLGLSALPATARTMSELERQIPGIKSEFARPTQTRITGQDMNLHRGGSNRPVRVSISPIVTQPQNHPGWMVHLSELTHIHALNRQLTQSRRFSGLGRLAVSLAREIQNPLTMINLSARQMEGNQSSSDYWMRYAKMVGFQMDRLEKLQNALLLLGQEIQPDLAPVRVGSLIEDELSILAPELKQKQIEIHYNRTNGASALADRGLLSYVFFNLIANAIHSMPLSLPNRSISITVSEGSQIVVSISDTGTGISDDLMPHLFDPFSQVRKSGAGLGLPIAKAIMDAHQGSLEITSGRGSGTTAVVSLPISNTTQVFTVKVKATPERQPVG